LKTISKQKQKIKKYSSRKDVETRIRRKLKAAYIADDERDASILIDPMRRAILEFLRQKPMTQAQLASELGLSTN
jgi:DNA-binding transcriptional ArsR family regulator